MKFLAFAFLYIMIYVMIGAVIGSVYYYITLRENMCNGDTDTSIIVGVCWPFVAPFAFGLYFARKLSKKDKK